MRSYIAFAILPVALLCGCGVGPASVVMGRSVYRDVINQTEDEQLLNLIVRDRYSDTYGMLAVASVTASLRARADLGADFGLSRAMQEDYAGNLVPLRAGVSIEENPTISYVPIGGEKFVQRLLSPLSMEELLLMGQFLPQQRDVFLRVVFKSINDIRNPMHDSEKSHSAKFGRVVDLWSDLVHRGVLRIVRDAGGRFVAAFNVGEGGLDADVIELLEALGIRTRPVAGRLLVPVRVAAPGWEEDTITLESCSVLEIVRAAGACIEIPESHVKAGVISPRERPASPFMCIRSAATPPGGAGAVAIQYRGWWYYVDDADPDSKCGFLFLRTLVGLRLSERSKDAEAPVLTIPVR